MRMSCRNIGVLLLAVLLGVGTSMAKSHGLSGGYGQF